MTRINLADIVADQFGDAAFEVTASVTFDELFDRYELSDIDLDLDEVLADRHAIAFEWHIEDVKQQRPDLDDDQCWEVLKQCQKSHDANIGMNWFMIDSAAEMLFGTAPQADSASDAFTQ